MTGPAEPTLVDGIDVDAVAAAVRGCPAVDDLDGGLLGGVATYLPGRRVPGIRIAEDRIEVHVRGVWDQPVGLVVSQIRQALAPLVAGRVVDVYLTDIADPPWAKAEPAEPPGAVEAAAPASGAGSPAVLADGTVEPWTTPSASAEPSGGSSSASTIPTAAEIRPSS